MDLPSNADLAAVASLAEANNGPVASRCAELRDLTAHPKRIIIYDTRSAVVEEDKIFADDVTLIEMKGILINAIESYSKMYGQSLKALIQETNAVVKTLGAKRDPGLLDDNVGMMLLSRSQSRMEQAFQQVMAWDGEKQLDIVLPYAALVMNSESKKIDIRQSNPYANGMIFSAYFSE